MHARIPAVTLLILSLFVPIKVFAVDAPVSSSSSSRDQRLAGAVNDQHLVLDDARKALLVQKCESAQSSLMKLQEKADKIAELRTNTYGTFQKELQGIKLRMARQGVDASEIDLLIGKIQQGLDSFTLAADAYGTSLDDVISVDCKQKPEQFQAGLVVLRKQRANLLVAANNLTKIMEAAKQNTFTQLKKRLTV